MKYLKIFAFMLGAALFTACSNDDDKREFNTVKDVTVSMASTTIDTKENRGIIDVPFVVNGETNGYVVVTCKVAEVSNNPAMEDVHYLVTSKSVTLEPKATEGSFEISLVDDREINEAREFIVTLESAAGATLGTQQMCTVVIGDNDSDPYSRLGGQWGILDQNGGMGKTITIQDFDEGEDGYHTKYLVYDLFDYPVDMSFSYNDATKKATMSINYGIFKLVEIGSEVIVFANIDGYLHYSGAATFEWNAEEDADMIKLISVPSPQNVEDGASLWMYKLEGNSLVESFGSNDNVCGFKQR
ncbi:MAG: hypothetical protein K2N16_04090 [Muribaculaceae bacterium]|nr:hypothetical protein [Muribaculaceae bacterium]